MTSTLVAGVARELPVNAGQAVRLSSFDLLPWALVAVVVVATLILLEVAKSRPRENPYRRMADMATNPVVGIALGLVVLGGWRVSPVVVSVLAVAAMILLEMGKSLPGDHRHRQLADDLTAPLVVIAFDVVLLCGWQLAEIIGFVP